MLYGKFVELVSISDVFIMFSNTKQYNYVVYGETFFINRGGDTMLVLDPSSEAIKARNESAQHEGDGIHIHVPIDPQQIAETFGLKVCEVPLQSNVSGFLLKKDGNPATIYVNQHDSDNRKRFTIAHEIGHFWYHRQDPDDDEYGYVEYRDDLSSRGTDSVERWANAFAAELLMPAQYVRVAWARGDSVAKIQNELKVSEAALSHRLAKLGLLSHG